MIQILLEDIEKCALIKERQIVAFSLLSEDSGRQGHDTECGGLKSLPTIPRAVQLALSTSYASVHRTLPERQFYPCYIQSVKQIIPIHCTSKMFILSMDFATVGQTSYVYSKDFIHGRIMLL